MTYLDPTKLAWIVIAAVAFIQIHGPDGAAGVAGAQTTGVKQPSKIPHIVQERILQLETVARSRVKAPPTTASGDPVQTTQAGELILEFHAAGPVGDAEKADLMALGATILSSTADLVWPPGVQPPARLGIITARVPYDKVSAAAALPWVVTVTPAEASPPDVGTFLSEGVALHDADVVQAAGITGAGVTVGAISDGVNNLAAAQALGDLPAVAIPPGCVGAGGDEGTAMLEIIADMAPGAALLFCATGGGVAAHVNALLTLAAAGANVITEDIPFDTEPAFQKGVAATTGDTLAVGGISVHSSAGNLGSRHAARVAAVGTGGGPDGAAGPFGGCPYNPQNVVAIAPGGDTTFDVQLPAGGGLNVTLQWSEPRAIFPTAGAGGFTNLDLFVMDQALTTCLGSSANAQGNGAGDTIEQVFIGVAAAQTVKIVVNVAGIAGAVAAPLLDLRWRGGTAVDATTRAGSLNPDSNYTLQATSAAAANASVSTDPTTVPIEAFSAGGPVQIISTTVCPGAYPCPGAAIAGGAGSTVGAPTWTAADGVSVSGVGNFGAGTCPAVVQGDCRFFGTSAAAPHAAAIDALFREAVGGTPTVPQITALMAATATDRGSAGFDNVWGFGVLSAALAANPFCFGLPATIFVQNGLIVGGPDDGRPYRGILRGTQGDDVIVGTAESDLIKGYGGNDVICSGDGRDIIEGGYGDDLIAGGEGNDLIKGQQGDDTITGDVGNDIIEGGEGNDSLDGGPGTDLLKGQAGTDTCLNGEVVSTCE